MVAGLTSLTSALVGGALSNQIKSDVYIIELNDDTDAPTGSVLRFQYFPETLSDSKSVNYSPKEIPGGSLPLYQWVSSGERTIGFTAKFTTDTDLAVGRASEGPSPIVSRLRAAGAASRNVDIRSAITWLRRFILPRYGDNAQTGVPLTKAPRKLKLVVPNSGIGIYGGVSSNGENVRTDSIFCIMTRCEVTLESFFPNGLPRIASVELMFAQVAQIAGGVEFPQVTETMDQAVTGRKAFYGYTLQPRYRGPGL